MKKVLLLLLTAMLGLGAWQGSAQMIVEIPTTGGTTGNSYLPSYSFYNYSLTQQIYTAAEIGMHGTINSVAFYNSGDTKTRSYTLYMVNTNKTSFSGSSDWITVTAADQVFTGSVTMTGSAWTTIQLDDPFVYDGVSNLAIIMDDNTGSYSSGMSCYVFDATGMALRVYSDDTNYDPMAPTSYSGTVMNVKNHIKLDITPGNISCHAVGVPTVSGISSNDATIIWGTPEDAGSYILQYKTSDLDWTDNGVVTDFPSDTTYDFNSLLTPQTDYNVRIANMCTNGDTSLWRTVNFRTTCAGIDSLPYTENFDNWGTGSGSNYPECWTKSNTYTAGTTPYVSSTSYEGAGSLYFYVGSASQYNMAVMHAIDPLYPINTLQISFAYRASNSTDRLIVGVMDDITDGSTFTPVDTVYPVPGSVSTWDERIVLFDNYTGSGTHIAFKNEYTTTYCYAYIDNLVVEPIVLCSKPTQVTVSNYTTEGADIDWTPGASEDSWEVVAVAAGADVSTGTPVPASTHPFTLTGLSDNTTYDIYVRGVCGGGDYSGWTFKRTFTTNPTCSSPLHVTVSQITTNSALVSWDNAIFGTPTYTVAYSEAGQNNWTVQNMTAGATQYMISGLTLNTDYVVYVAPVCATGSADSIVVPFHTRACLVGGDLEIGNGTSTSSYLPDYTYYNYAYMEEIYLASEMNGPAALQSIAFDASSVNTPNRTIKLYLMHTTATSEGSTWLDPSTAQLVYDSTITWTTGWNTIYFNTPFQYNGVDNLAVILVDETGSYSSSNSFHCHTTSTSMARYVYNDGSAYTLPPTSSGTTSTNRNNVIFGVPCDSTSTCSAPNAYVTAVTDNSLTVAWVPGNTETSWELEYHTEADTNWTSAGSVTSPYTITGLSENMIVVVRVRSNCGAGQTSNWAATSGRTKCPVVNTLPLEEHFDAAPSVGPDNTAYCWSTLSNYSSSYPGLSTSYANSGNYSVYFYGTSAYFSYLISPEFDASIPMNNLQVRFWARKASPTYYIQVGVMTDPNDYSTFTQVGSDLSPDTVGTWRFLDVNLDQYTGNGHYVAFRIPQNYVSYMYVDDIAIDVIPTCAHVDSIHVSDVQTTGATVEWVPGGSESAWDVAFVPGTGAVDLDTVNLLSATGSPSITVNDLEMNTIYTVYVRANCGADQSFWMSTEFMTTQIPGVLPYYCDFEDTIQGHGFGIVNGTQPHQWVVGTATNNGGTHALYISGDNGTSNTYNNGSTSNTWAYRDIEFPANPSGYTLSFDWHADGESCCDYMRVFVGTPTPVTAGSLDQPAGSTAMVPNVNTSYPNYFNTSSNYQTFTTTIPGMTETTVKRIYFLWHNDGSVGTNPPAAVDNITIEVINCDAPTALSVDSIAITTAMVSWNSNASSSVLSYKGPNDPDWTVVDPATSPYELTGLTGNTLYQVRVANNCDDGVSTSPSISTSFYTDCDAISTLPYTENFDGYTASTSTRPNCWAFPITYSNAPYITSNYSSSSPNSLYFQSETTNPTTAVSPQIDADIHNLRVKFMLKAESTTSSGTFDIGVMSDPNDVTTFESVRIIQPANTAWNQYVVDFDSTVMTGTGRYIAFRQHSNSSVYYYWLDNVMIMNIPTCPEPEDLVATGTTSTSITLGWSAGSETSWNIEYGPTGFTQGQGTSISVSTNPYTIDNLTSGTSYDFYVQADCGAGDESIWTGPYTAIPGSINMPATGTTTISACDVTIYDNGGPTGDYTSNCQSTMTINPDAPMNLVAIQGTLSTESCCDYLRIYDGPDATGTLLGEFRDENQTIPQLVSTTGPLTLYFYSDGSVQKSGFELTVSCVSNTCPMPTNLTVSNVGQSSATVSWTAGGNETSWIVEYKEASATTWTVDNATTTTYQLSNLTGLTAYDVRVKADCIDETSLYATTSFTTPNCDAANACLYTFILTDSYGDGWNDGYLTVEQGGVVVATLEATDNNDTPSSETVTINLCDNVSTSLVWHSGNYDDEAGFSIAGPDGTVLFSQDSMDTYTTYTFTTNCNGSGPVPTNPTVATNAATAVAQTTATLNATITNPDNVTITAKGFEWKATQGGTYTQIAGTGTGNTFTANLTGLTANTGYTFRAFITFNGQTVTGNEMTFTTQNQDVEPCDVPTGVTVSAVTDESITITWNNAAGVNSWNIQYRPVGGTLSSATSNTNSYTINGLQPETTYEIQVQANCGGGNLSEWSSAVTGTTTVGIDSWLANSVSLYPNPAKEYVDIRVDGDLNVKTMEVFDVYGKLINTVIVTENPTRINISGLANGMYFVRVTTEEGMVTKTFVKK
ncbi:MAG: fibronectin type III domain-containing protein [Bacteroidales bacterium]|nr:fibronectin type III domain-containing protein [Bacteroidales bacterium]